MYTRLGSVSPYLLTAVSFESAICFSEYQRFVSAED